MRLLTAVAVVLTWLVLIANADVPPPSLQTLGSCTVDNLFSYIEEAGINGDFADVTGPCTDVRAYEARNAVPTVPVPFSDVTIRLQGEYCIAFIARAVAGNTAPLFSFYDALGNVLGGVTYGNGEITYDLNRDIYPFPSIDTQDWQRYQLCSDGRNLTLYQDCVAVAAQVITPTNGFNDDQIIYLLTNPDGGLFDGSVASLYFINCGGSDRATQAAVAGIQCQHIDTSCSRTSVSIDTAVTAFLRQINAGDTRISGNMTIIVHSDLNGASPQFTLTCISTGGPATTVTWTRNSTTVTQGTQTVLNDPVTANYTHTLNVTGGLPGLYTCTVANNKPSNDSGCIAISAHLPVTILPLDATTVKISWTSSVFFSTSFQYSSSFNASGLVITHYKTVLPRNTGSIDVSLDDEFEGYEHSFTLRRIYNCDQVILLTAPAVKFAFDKEYFQIQFGPFDYCLDWEVMKVSHIEHQLQSRLIRIIRENCAECFQLSPSFLRKGVFLCHGNPTKTTYRTTLVNPFPTTNSTHLVGIIQSWVSTGPSLILDGLLVRVSLSCPTSISSLDEEECETGTAHDPALGDRITQTLNVCAVRNLGEELCSLGGC